MFLRIIFILVIVITNTVLAAELVSRLDADDSDANSLGSTEASLVAEDSAEPLLVLPECTLQHTSTTETNPLGNLGQMFTAQRRMSFENNDDNNLAMSNEFRMNTNRLMNRRPNGRNVHLSLQHSDNGFQLLEMLGRTRQVDNRDDGVPVFRILEHRQTPQTHIVDNTLRLMSIKSSLDELLLKLFPNIHLLQRMVEDRGQRSGKSAPPDQ